MMVNAIIGFIILLIGMAVVSGLSKSGNKVDNVKGELRNLAAETSNGLTGTIGKINRKLNNWMDPKIDIYTAQKRLERTNIKYQIKHDGDLTMITAFDKYWSTSFDKKPGEFFSVEYKNGKYVRWSFADDLDGVDFEHRTNDSGKAALEKLNNTVTENKKRVSYRSGGDAGINKKPKESPGKEALPDNVRNLYWPQEATEESQGTSQSSIEDNHFIEENAQGTTKTPIEQDKSKITHHFDLLTKKVAKYKSGSINAVEVSIAVSTFISTAWPNYSEQKKNDLYQALVEQLGIVFE